jgi:hypothetical protein
MASHRHRWIWLLGALAAVVAFVLVWFQPQKLFIDERVSDPVPVAAADLPTTTPAAEGSTTTPAAPTASEPITTAPAAPTATAGPVDLAGGEFVSLDHGTSGTVRILALADGRRFVRLEGLDTDNGPDLYLYLSANPAGGPEQAFDDDYLSLGRLQGNLGDQNYELPPDVDPLAYASVVIWCDRFNSAFGAADLTEV